MAMWYGGTASFATRRPATQADHLGGSPGFIDEDKSPRVEVELPLEPGLAGILTSSGCCSLACAVFFERDVALVVEMSDRGFADREPEFRRQLLGDLMKRDVGFLLNHIQNEGFMGIQLRTRRLTSLARHRLAMLLMAPPAIDTPMPSRRAA